LIIIVVSTVNDESEGQLCRMLVTSVVPRYIFLTVPFLYFPVQEDLPDGCLT
jgi:hypothetical protein